MRLIVCKVRQAVSAQSEYLVMWMRDGDYAYYDSKLLPKASGLGSRDPLKEAMDEAAKHKLPIIAYCVVQQGGHFLRAHPEWAMRGVDGSSIGRFCYNSGYLEARRLLVSAVHLLHPLPQVRVSAPANVESIITNDRANRTLRIYLLGYNAPPQTLPVNERPYVLPALMEDVPTFRTTMELRDSPQSVTALNPTTILKWKDRQIDVTVNDVHEVIVVTY